jgi:diaminopimelate epimerase
MSRAQSRQRLRAADRLASEVRVSTISFQKIQATGNDFLFIDARKPLCEKFLVKGRSSLARAMCDRHFGVGADGVVFVEKSETAGRLKWDFYNSDGSPAEMCGNASRCMGRWAERNLKLSTVEFETLPGLVRAEVDAGAIASQMDYLNLAFSSFEYEAAGAKKRASFVNTGVPHAVVQVEDIAQAKTMLDDVRALRFHALTGARGTNVTFVQIRSRDRFSTITFERGVEDFTLSCGTGVMAAAAVGLLHWGGTSPWLTTAWLSTPGGALEVTFGDKWLGATLKGPADYVYEGNLFEEFATCLEV